MDIIAAIIFALALIHTFAAKTFERLAHKYPRHAGLLHFFGEVEVVFGDVALRQKEPQIHIAHSVAAFGVEQRRQKAGVQAYLLCFASQKPKNVECLF